MSLDVGATVRLGRELTTAIVRHVHISATGAEVLGLEAATPLPFTASKVTGDGAIIHADGRVERLFGPCTPGCGVFRLAHWVLPADEESARAEYAARKIQGFHRGTRYRLNAERRFQRALHSLEEQEEQAAVEASIRLAMSEADARRGLGDGYDSDSDHGHHLAAELDAHQHFTGAGAGAGAGASVGASAASVLPPAPPKLVHGTTQAQPAPPREAGVSDGVGDDGDQDGSNSDVARVKHLAILTGDLDDEGKACGSPCTPTRDIKLPDNYEGLRLDFPLTEDSVQTLRDYFAHHEVLHYKFVLKLLYSFAETLDPTPEGNVVDVSVPEGDDGKLIIVGDVHGQLADVLHIFDTHGPPSATTRYLFNGDLVDRGDRGLEIFLLTAAYRVLDPDSVIIHRGNHEDAAMNKTSGFQAEVFTKYDPEAAKLVYERFLHTFWALPLASVVEDRVFVTHGGLSDEKNVVRSTLSKVVRFKDIPTGIGGDTRLSRFDRIFECLMWSDPSDDAKGSSFNQSRNCAIVWGEDVTDAFLAQNKFELIIRSHQVVAGGIQTHHNNKVVTLFSASNYCGGDYDGCVLCLRKGFTVEDITKRSSPARFTHNVKPAVTRFQLMPKAAVMAACNGDYSEFVKACLAAEAITGRRDELFAMFSEHDPAASGIIAYDVCTDILNDVVPIHVDWRVMLRAFPQPEPPAEAMLFKQWTAFKVRYLHLLDRFQVDTPKGFEKGLRDIVSARLLRLYRATLNMECCETARQWCNAFETTPTGEVTYPEFIHVCKHLGVNFADQELYGIAEVIDVSGTGKISFEEVQTCFQVELVNSAISAGDEWAIAKLNLVAESLFMHYQTAVEAFKGSDSNFDNKISLKEFQEFIATLHLGDELTAEDAERLFGVLDTNGDGGIDKDEFMQGFKFAFQPKLPRRPTPRARRASAHARAIRAGSQAPAAKPQARPPTVTGLPPPVPGPRAGQAAPTLPPPAPQRSQSEDVAVATSTAGVGGACLAKSATHDGTGASAGAGAGAGVSAGGGGAGTSDTDGGAHRSERRMSTPTAPAAALQRGPSAFVRRIVQQIAVEMHRFSTSLQALFEVFAGRKAAQVNKRQFQRGLARLRIGKDSAMKRLTRAEMSLLFDCIDTNGDGLIDVNEFTSAFRIKDTTRRHVVLDRRALLTRRVTT